MAADGSGNTIVFARDEVDLIAALAGCSLDEKPGSNWVEANGGLPTYICQIARAVKRSGKSTSQAIAIAVSRVKKWAAGAGVDAKTQAKASAALAEWEKLRAKSHTKAAAKDVKASNTDPAVLLLAASTDYPVDLVKTAYRRQCDAERSTYRAANPTAAYDDDIPAYRYVKEQWTKFLVVAGGYDEGGKLYKVPYSVDGKLNVTFGEPTEVKTAYVAVPTGDVDDTGLTDPVLAALAAAQPGCQYTTLTLTFTGMGDSAVDRVLRYTDGRG